MERKLHCAEEQYLELLSHLYLQGKYEHQAVRDDRTKVGCRSVFGAQIKHSMMLGLPLLTTKKIHVKSVIEELLWMLRGETNNNGLKAKGVSIWDEWAKPDGDLGPIYGQQWRKWDTGKFTQLCDSTITHTVDQIANLQKSLKEDPYSRRHIVSAWNVADLPEMALAPCHCLFQCFVREERGTRILDLQLYQRSADIFLGVPFNLASYGILLYLLANHCGYTPGELITTYGDLHLYENHREQADEQLSRLIRPRAQLILKASHENVWDYEYSDFSIWDYNPHPAIPAPVAI